MSRGRSDLSDAFAIVLKRHRVAKKMSKEALAQKAGLHQTYIGLIERGDRNPSLDASNRIAGALGVKLSGLIQEAEKLLKSGDGISC
jgi:transcriptional regulator with XRE-family HTH domain